MLLHGIEGCIWSMNPINSQLLEALPRLESLTSDKAVMVSVKEEASLSKN